jgi:creatinine amidohydrolase
MASHGTLYYGDLAWPVAVAALRSQLLVLPVGAIEQHGPHLPLSVDIDLSTEFAKAVASELDAIVAPGISYGARSLPQSGGGPAFPGTIFARGQMLTGYYADIIRGYAEAGARRILIINGHYENEAFLFEGIELCRESGWLASTRVVALSWWSVVDDHFLNELFSGQFPGWHAEHAGLCETSLMLHLRPDVVGEDRPDNANPPRAGIYRSDVQGEEIAVKGVLAQSSGASRAIGEMLFKSVCEGICKITRESLREET